jgi:RNA polymerase sigma-70 factor (ECF subfamily)
MTTNGSEADPGHEERTAQLVRAAQEDRAGFDPLYRHLESRLFAWATLTLRGAVREWVSPEDLVSEVWLRGLDGFSKYDPQKGDFRGWLFKIAYQTHSELRRKERLRRAEPVPEELARESTSVGSRVARDESLRFVIREVMERFDEDELRLFMLRGLEELAFEDISELLGVSAAALTKRWQRMRARLRAIEGLEMLLPK